MRTILVILLVIFSVAVFSPLISIAVDMTQEEYVYALEVRGVVTYKLGNNNERGKKVRRMELILPGTVLKIGKDAMVLLTCPGCKNLILDNKNSPYTVNMADFKKDKVIKGEIWRYFTDAIKNFIYPDSKIGPKVEIVTRGLREEGCITLWSIDGKNIMPIGDIMPIGEHITFEWTSTDLSPVSIEIKEFDNKERIHFEKISSKNKINVPAEKFKSGRRYEWSLIERETQKRCNATFALLTKNERTEIMKILDDIPSLLPPEADNETRYRLQAGYLHSKGLDYDAWQWLELNRVLQQ